MSKPHTEIVCLLTVKGGPIDHLEFAAVAPDKMYSVLDKSLLPEAWEFVSDSVEAQSDYEVIGALVITDMDEETTGGQAQ